VRQKTVIPPIDDERAFARVNIYLGFVMRVTTHLLMWQAKANGGWRPLL
jgi:hypothetical protein